MPENQPAGSASDLRYEQDGRSEAACVSIIIHGQHLYALKSGIRHRRLFRKSTFFGEFEVQRGLGCYQWQFNFKCGTAAQSFAFGAD
jgi:hypothetical protein